MDICMANLSKDIAACCRFIKMDICMVNLSKDIAACCRFIKMHICMANLSKDIKIKQSINAIKNRIHNKVW